MSLLEEDKFKVGDRVLVTYPGEDYIFLRNIPGTVVSATKQSCSSIFYIPGRGETNFSFYFHWLKLYRGGIQLGLFT